MLLCGRPGGRHKREGEGEGRGARVGAGAGSDSGVHRAGKRSNASGKGQEACGGALGAWMAWLEAEWRSYFIVSLLGYGVGLACCVCSSASLDFRLAEVESF